ncbi:MAG: hypothetical protein RRA35_03290 [Desulfomonilia bacterium]|nr:hypothetical protein [Desulfomonilia bacterium]
MKLSDTIEYMSVKRVSGKTVMEYRESLLEKWEDVRPVVIYFAGERFVVEYDEHGDPLSAPVVALVHSYLGNIELTKNDN